MIWAVNPPTGVLIDPQYATSGGRLENVGFLFGAVGDRKDNSGIFWMEYPFGELAGGYSYQIPVGITVEGSATYYRHHSLTVSGAMPWVVAAGVEARSKITVTMVADGKDSAGKVVPVVSPAHAYDVTLYFAEPNEKAKAGDRVFSVTVNGIDAGSFNVAKTVGPRTLLSKTIPNVMIDKTVEITSSASAGKTLLCGVSFRSLAK